MTPTGANQMPPQDATLEAPTPQPAAQAAPRPPGMLQACPRIPSSTAPRVTLRPVRADDAPVAARASRWSPPVAALVARVGRGAGAARPDRKQDEEHVNVIEVEGELAGLLLVDEEPDLE